MKPLRVFLLCVVAGVCDSAYLRQARLLTPSLVTGDATIAMPEAYRADLTFYAPLKSNLYPSFARGSNIATYTRNSVASYLSPTTNLITYVVANQPRFEANGYLSEGARTNSLKYSSSPTGAGWVLGQVSVTPFVDVSPDGTLTGAVVGAVANSGSLYQPITLANSADTGSIYIKRKTGTGAVYLAINGSTATGWNEVTATSAYTRVTRTETVLNPVFGIQFQTAGDEVYIWGGQLEAGAFASTFVPTTSSAVARAADLLYYIGASNNPATANHTVGFTGDVYSVAPPIYRSFIDTTGGLGANGVNVYSDTSTDTLLLSGCLRGGAFRNNGISSYPITVNVPFNLYVANAPNDFEVFFNSLGIGKATGPMPVAVCNIYVGSYGATLNTFGHNKAYKIFSSRLAAWELAQIRQ